MSENSDVTVNEAIAELGEPTGDPQRDEINQGMAENLRLGYLKIAGRGEDGALQFRLTPAGNRFVEGMGKR